MIRVPILTYHPLHIDGNAYAENDHVAFREDLELLHRLGWKVAPLDGVIDAMLAGHEHSLERTVVLTMDDGSDFDAVDLVHPFHGLQRSMLNLLEDFRVAHGSAQPSLHATTFVIVSPEARQELTQTCMLGLPWWNEHWWRDAIASGLLSVGNHSWDHNHASLKHPIGGHSGDFHTINHRAVADAEIRVAAEYLSARAPNRAQSLFAYPYGHANEYLVNEYFADPQLNPGVIAAIASQGEPYTRHHSRWNIPRYVFTCHWNTPDELEALLRESQSPVFAAA